MLANNIAAIRKHNGIIVELFGYIGLLCDIVLISSEYRFVVAFPLHNPVVKMSLRSFYRNTSRLRRITNPNYQPSEDRSGFETAKFLSKENKFTLMKHIFIKGTESINSDNISPISYGSTLFPSLDFVNNLPILSKKFAISDLLTLQLINQNQHDNFMNTSQINEFEKLENIPIKPFDSSLVYTSDWNNVHVKPKNPLINLVLPPLPRTLNRKKQATLSKKRKTKSKNVEESPQKRFRSDSENESTCSLTEIVIPTNTEYSYADLNAPLSQYLYSSSEESVTSSCDDSINSTSDDCVSDSDIDVETYQEELEERGSSSTIAVASSSGCNQENDRNSDVEEIIDDTDCDDEVHCTGERRKHNSKGKQFTADQYPLVRAQIREAGRRIIAYKERYGEEVSQEDEIKFRAPSIEKKLCNGELDNVYLSVLEKYIKDREGSGESIVSHDINNIMTGRFDPHTCMLAPYKANKDGQVKCKYANKEYNVPRLFAHLMYNEPGRFYPSQPLAYLDCSHVRCNNPSCFNPWHIVLEPGQVNLSRKKCHARTQDCCHDMRCGLDGRDVHMIKKEKK